MKMADALPILTFHSLDNSASVTSFRPTLFRSGLVRLHEMEYRSLRLQQVVNCLREKNFPGVQCTWIDNAL